MGGYPDLYNHLFGRRIRMRLLESLIYACLLTPLANATDVLPLAPQLMKSTFRIEGPNVEGKTSTGTCFLFNRRMRSNPNAGWNVLVTANHVLTDIAGDQARVFLRLAATNGTYSKLEATIAIRIGGKPLWYRHPEVDVAAMIAALPGEFVRQHEWLPEALLAGDEVFKERAISAGDELMCLGFPLGLEANAAGFPILRSGRIASFPVTPTTVAKSFLFDIPVYGGNSGGPVFFDYRKRRLPGVDSNQWVDIIGIAGLISQDVSEVSKVEGYFETITRRNPLGLAVVIPAEFIKQTVDQLFKQVEPDAQPGGAANGSPPVGSETNRTSGAAGSRR
jgi:hypothetical protein